MILIRSLISEETSVCLGGFVESKLSNNSALGISTRFVVAEVSAFEQDNAAPGD